MGCNSSKNKKKDVAEPEKVEQPATITSKITLSILTPQLPKKIPKKKNQLKKMTKFTRSKKLRSSTCCLLSSLSAVMSRFGSPK
jgi:hypothetical protein